MVIDEQGFTEEENVVLDHTEVTSIAEGPPQPDTIYTESEQKVIRGSLHTEDDERPSYRKEERGSPPIRDAPPGGQNGPPPEPEPSKDTPPIEEPVLTSEGGMDDLDELLALETPMKTVTIYLIEGQHPVAVFDTDEGYWNGLDWRTARRALDRGFRRYKLQMQRARSKQLRSTVEQS